ncbi:MAG: riboflavin biosynthesis protein RibF [Bacteroidales bacterium]|nr:riboflavin biosynthesis protein RibF [Bacteroidales bacterium]
MAVVTTGFFDGVHLGHRYLLDTVVSSARERGEEAVVVTFWPHPRTVLQQDARDLRLLTSLQEKKDLLAAAGIDRVEVIPFTRDFAAMTAADYLRMLRERFGASMLVMGYDNHIGSDCLTASQICSSEAVGRPDMLLMGEFAPTSCHSERAQRVEESISSTQIRKALTAGDIDRANGMLGYRYSLLGVVVAGNRLGRTIGFPTANMKLYEPLKLVPAVGVYAVDVEVLGRKYRGMTNIGVRPTVGGGGLTIETNIFDFDEDIYGLDIRITFLARIRDERRFASLEELKEQLLQDKHIISAL